MLAYYTAPVQRPWWSLRSLGVFLWLIMFSLCYSRQCDVTAIFCDACQTLSVAFENMAGISVANKLLPSRNIRIKYHLVADLRIKGP